MPDFQKAKLQRELDMARLHMANALKALDVKDPYILDARQLRQLISIAVTELRAR